MFDYAEALGDHAAVVEVQEELEAELDEESEDMSLIVSNIVMSAILMQEVFTHGSELTTRVRAKMTKIGLAALEMRRLNGSWPTLDAAAQAAGVDQLVALPIFPLCGRSTTIAALDDVQVAVDKLSWDVPLREITGWHRHPAYRRLRADAILAYVKRNGVDLHASDTRLVFSAHGTPLKYLADGPRYVNYVEEACRNVARELGISDYTLGYQNHTNRDIEWTVPEIQTVIREIDATRVIVDAVSFMHEQSETLGELDGELRKIAEEAGLEFHRIPIPHDDPAFAELLADLVEDVLRPEPIMGELGLRRCLCRATPTTFCLNAAD
ncbi:MAG: ferrochelatase [Gemmatimonadetes bacterium]|nr:ferrochelatase [Gemmatimonadota bacterium]